jgi:imidazolonepropionase-like amidohydrolase
MKFKACLLLLVTLAINCLVAAQGQRTASDGQNRQVVAFVNVNVIPMDRERIVEGQTVIVRDGRIAEIGPAAKTKVPDGALRVEARGKYLMPGIAEMHGHMPHPNQGEQIAKSFLTLFVANGVTTVRTMYGFHDNSIPIRDKVARGEILGPRLYVAGPAMSGQSVQSPEQGEQLVRQYKKDGYDLLKIHEGLSQATYDRIVATAKEVGIPFGGHIPNAVGVESAIKARQNSIEHLDGYVEALESDDSPIKNADPQTRGQKLHEYLDEKKIPKLVQATREAGVWNVPTMALWQTFMGTETVESLKARPELKYIPPQMVAQWSQARANQIANNDAPQVGMKLLGLRDKILKALANSGAMIMAGSDAPQLFSVPGYSLHREMQAMIKAGLTPYQVLESATRNPAIYLNRAAEFGTIEVGKRADLILVDENPLKDIANLGRRSGVMLGGRWIAEGEIRKMLDDIAATYTAQK